MKIILLYIFFICINVPLYMNAQIGINTEAPTAILDIKSNSSTMPIIKISNSDIAPLLTLENNGYLGIGVSSPTVKVDLRSATLNQNALGLGTTNLSANIAGEGAVRYNPNNKSIEYSDGTNWVVLEKSINKFYVIADHSNGLSINDRTDYSITNWKVIAGNTNNEFNPITGRFIVPRSNIYAFSSAIALTGITTTVADGIQLDFVVYKSGQTAPIQIAKSWVSIPIADDVNSTIINKSYFYLDAGDAVEIHISQYLSNSIELSKDSSLNNLTIAEL